MNTTANIAYLKERRKAGVAISDLSPANAQAYEMLDELTDNFTDMDMISADATFEKTLDLLVQAWKAGESKDSSADRREDPPKSAAGAKDSKGSAPKKPKAEKAAKAPKAEKTAKAPKAEKVAKGPDKQTAAYLAAKHVKGATFELGLIRRFISLTRSSTKEKLIAALATFKKSYQSGKWSKDSKVIDVMRAIQAEYLRVLNTGKAPYQIQVDEPTLANYVAIVGGEKVYKSVELLNKFTNWMGQEKSQKQIATLRAEIATAKAKGKIGANDPYADKVNDIIRVLEKAKAGESFKAEAAELNGLAGLLGCACHTPMSGVKKRKLTTAKKKALVKRAKTLNGLGEVPDVVDTPKAFPGVITSAQIETVNYKKYTFAQPWGELFGEPQTNANVMVWGEPGQGKSTFSFKLARYLATSHGPVLYVSSEEIRDGMPSFTIKKKLDMVGGSVPGWDFAGDVSKLQAKHKFLFVDSVNDSKMTRADLSRIKSAHPGLFVVLIFQATKTGQFKGENDWGHDVDVVLEVGAGKATTTKNRFAELSTIQIF